MVPVETMAVVVPPRNRQNVAAMLVQWFEFRSKRGKPGSAGCILAILTPGGQANFDHFPRGTSADVGGFSPAEKSPEWDHQVGSEVRISSENGENQGPRGVFRDFDPRGALQF
jgi:hypothetical protein